MNETCLQQRPPNAILAKQAIQINGNEWRSLDFPTGFDRRFTARQSSAAAQIMLSKDKDGNFICFVYA
jgi:hypothetical protein